MTESHPGPSSITPGHQSEIGGLLSECPGETAWSAAPPGPGSSGDLKCPTGLRAPPKRVPMPVKQPRLTVNDPEKRKASEAIPSEAYELSWGGPSDAQCTS